MIAFSSFSFFIQVLHLYGNPSLSGSLPPSLGELKSLEELRLWGCSLSGSLPPALGGCATLKVKEMSGFVLMPL